MRLTLFEKAPQAGVSMPYSDHGNSRLMLANIARIEIPPIAITYLAWLRQQENSFLARFGVDKKTLHERPFVSGISACAQIGAAVARQVRNRTMEEKEGA